MCRLIPLRYSGVFLAWWIHSSPAFAHAEVTATHWWTLDPWVWIPMLVTCGLYLRGVLTLRMKKSPVRAVRPYALTSFALGMAALFIALIWPLDALSGVSAAAHMAQHMLLIAVAAPLLALAAPGLPILAALPREWRRINAHASGLHRALQVLFRPRMAFFLHSSMIWFWHAPLPYEAALQSEWLHAIEHIAFLGSALLYWGSLFRTAKSAEDYGFAALWTLALMIHTGILGALFTFSPRVLYSIYNVPHAFGLSPIEDQQLAGLLMWIPGGVCYMVAGIGFAFVWLRRAEARTDLPDEATPVARRL